MLLIPFLLAIVAGTMNPQVICYFKGLKISEELERIVHLLYSGEEFMDAVLAFGANLLDG